MAVFGPDCALHRLERWATGVACTADLAHHAACREGCGLGMGFGRRPPSAVRALNRGRLPPFSLRITPRRTAGRGWRSSGRTAPCTFGALGAGRLPSCSVGPHFPAFKSLRAPLSFRPFCHAHSGYGPHFRTPKGDLSGHCPALHGFYSARCSVGSKRFSRKQNALQAVS